MTTAWAARNHRAEVQRLLGPCPPAPRPSPWRKKPAVRRALLVYPPTGLFDRSDRCQTPLDYAVAQTARPPLDLALVAATLEERGVRCAILDLPAAGGSWEDLAEAARREGPDLLVVTTTVFTLEDDLLACDLVRSFAPDCRTIVKGNLIGADTAAILEGHAAVDGLLLAEDERTVARLLEAEDPTSVRGLALREGGAHVETPPAEGADLDVLPAPARHLLDNRLYTRPDTARPMTTVLVERGCPYPCTFCLVPVVSGRAGRTRRPERIAAEIADCIGRHGIGDFLLKADTFNLDRAWALEVCRALEALSPRPRWVTNSRLDAFDLELARRMTAAGCWLVAFGLESGSPSVQRQAAKELQVDQVERALRACREAGLRSLLYLTLGLPGETRETVRETVRYVRGLPWDFVEVHLAVAFPGTPLHRQAVQRGLLAAPLGTSRGGGPVPHLVRSEALSHGELAMLRLKVLAQLYSDPRRAARSALGLPGGARAVWNLARVALPKMARNLTASWRIARAEAPP